MRRVVDEMIWIHAAYRFDTRQHMYRTLAAARRLLVLGRVRTPLEIQGNVIGDTTLSLVLKVPMFDESEYASSLIGLFRHAARQRVVEAHVDVA